MMICLKAAALAMHEWSRAGAKNKTWTSIRYMNHPKRRKGSGDPDCDVLFQVFSFSFPLSLRLSMVLVSGAPLPGLGQAWMVSMVGGILIFSKNNKIRFQRVIFSMGDRIGFIYKNIWDGRESRNPLVVR